MQKHPIQQLLAQVTKEYSRFDDGRIDYRGAPVSFGLNCFVLHGDDILLAERGANVIIFPHHWSGISGFIDTHESIEQLARRELYEEVGISQKHIAEMRAAPAIVQGGAGATCHIVPVRVRLHVRPELTVNWENKRVEWVPIRRVGDYTLIPGFMELLEAALSNELRLTEQ